MFWGLIMEPKRRYTQTVKRPFHVSMAALDIFASNNEPCQVMLDFEDRHYLLCTLQKGKDVQCVLDLNFEAGNKVVFATNGDSNVHLTGYLVEDLEDYMEDQEEEEEEEIEDDFAVVSKKRKTRLQNQPPMKKSKTEQLLDEADDYDSNDDESFSLSKLGDDSGESASSDEDDDLDGDEEEDDDDEDDDDEENEESGDEEDEELSSLSDAEEKEVTSQVNGVASKRKLREVQKKLKREMLTESPNKSPTKKQLKEEKTPGKQDKSPRADISQKAKTPKGEKTPKGNKSEGNQKNGSAAKNTKEKAITPQKRTLEGGIIVQDIVVGDGQIVKPGKLAEVYYEGRLKQNNKVFDKLRQGPGFKFRLGKQEVIKGWDVGVAGMKVGGKRRITCPPNMAYGARGSPPQIPSNSTLVFEVELKNVK